MAEEQKPVTAVIVGNAPALQGQVATTLGDHPDIKVTVLNPLVSAFVRTLRVYLQTFVGILTAGSMGMAPEHLPAHDFWHLLQLTAGLALAPAVMCLLQNLIELLTRLDQSNPALRG